MSEGTREVYRRPSPAREAEPDQGWRVREDLNDWRVEVCTADEGAVAVEIRQGWIEVTRGPDGGPLMGYARTERGIQRRIKKAIRWVDRQVKKEQKSLDLLKASCS